MNRLNQNVYRDKVIMQIVLCLVFFIGPIILTGCDNDFCADSDNNSISLSITDGDGYLMVRAPWNNEIYFTKSSSFLISPENKPVTPQCFVLQGWTLEEGNPDPRGAITDLMFPEQCFIETTSLDGYISVQLDNGTARTPSLITVSVFVNPEGLLDVGNGLYRKTEASGQDITTTLDHSFTIDEETYYTGTIKFDTF